MSDFDKHADEAIAVGNDKFQPIVVPDFHGQPDGGFYAVYDLSQPGHQKYRTLARFPMTPEGKAACDDYVLRSTVPALDLHVKPESVDDLFLVDHPADNDDKHEDSLKFRTSWNVRIIWDEDTDEPGEVIYGGFTTAEDACAFQEAFPDDDYSDIVVEAINLVVFQ